jgi:adenylosuccinate lyase
VEDGLRVKEIEKTTNHDVKAIEYFLKEKFSEEPKLNDLKEYLHFSCTSEDINNLAYSMMLLNSMKEVMLPQLRSLLGRLEAMADTYSEVPMMCRTHGQSATPSTVGKEFANFAYRLRRQIDRLEKIEILGKFNGATGNLNAHMVAFPDKDWLNISKEFVEGLGVTWNPYTT